TGEVGTGKTTLCRMFLESLDENTIAAYIFNPKLDALQLLEAINDEFGIASHNDSLKTLIDRLNAFLLEKKAQGKRVLLLVDEAQNLSADVLEQLRLLSNLETTTSKLIQIILVGQPELDALLESDALRQLNQRITLSCRLTPLSFPETRDYIRHRIHIAARKPGLEFSAGALRSIFAYSGGVPRLINIACDRALLTAFSLGRHPIDKRIVKRAIRELEGKRGRHRNRSFYPATALGVLVLLLVLAVGVMVAQRLQNRNGRVFDSPVMLHANQNQPPAMDHPEPEDVSENPLPEIAVLPPAPRPLSAILTIPETIAPTPMDANAESAPVPLRLAAGDLEQVLDSTDGLDSLMGALTALLTVWNVQPLLPPPPETGVSRETFFRISARHSGMEVLRVQGGLNLIERLNLPAILEFPDPVGGDTRYLAVVGLAGDEVTLSDDAALFSVSPATMAGAWNGVAHVFWKNYYNYIGVIPISSPGDVILSLKVHLKAMGYPIEEISAAYDIATRRAVQEIQARHG
ncbi:MAG: AAA family ATPase, partial [Desulfosarcina sp.]